MTATHSTLTTVLVAIDISNHRHEVLIGIPGKKRRRRMTITNTLADFQRLSAALASYHLPVRIGFEATGNYHRALAHHLGLAGFDLKLVSSVGLARTREALHNSWGKNDPKDAQVILHMLEIGAVQFFHDPLVTGTADIQELSKTHEIFRARRLSCGTASSRITCRSTSPRRNDFTAITAPTGFSHSLRSIPHHTRSRQWTGRLSSPMLGRLSAARFPKNVCFQTFTTRRSNL